ncbi:heptaprenyl diphosphate synthase component 1 [Jeotgalibacillus soli]|uniref:Heptaprenyl diphosphate synthase n=1 Tax=Jeotgalibacillus soli TaxID=889306 RepID=A0A0C2R1M1_9BACL|nr:heptaprenyl diphosphate synthase component 1 [Jeotgalibacillus soli]KIL44205.1 hypothetical protein KP78_31690 [Jeotgalibacillus soli]
MKTNEINHWMEETLQYIEDQIRHGYLQQSIGAPLIDKDRLFLLIFPYQMIGSFTDLDRSYVSTAMLIQTALDTHEKVSKEQQDLLRVRQLTVLAGDYYSGLYYQILAKIPDIKLIRSIAHAIQEINEQKIELASLNMTSLEEFITSLKKIESAIITKFYKHRGLEQFSHIAEDLLVLKRLIGEQRLYEHGEYSILFSFLRNYLAQQGDRTTSVEGKVWDYYAKAVDELKESLEQKLRLLPDHIQSAIPSLFTLLHSSPERPKIYAEEG